MSCPIGAAGAASLFAGLVLCAAPGIVRAEQMGAPAPTCAALDATLSPSFAGWTTRADIVSATSAADLARSPIRPDAASRVGLHPMTAIAYPAPPAKPAAAGSNGGLLSLAIPRAGVWRVALSSGAWIDMVRNGQSVGSIAHERGPTCSTIRKIVDFRLRPGRYVLQLSGTPDAHVDVLVVNGD